MYLSFGKVMAGRDGAAGSGDMDEVTSANNLFVFEGAKSGSLNKVRGHGPLLPLQPKLTFSRFAEKARI